MSLEQLLDRFTQRDARIRALCGQPVIHEREVAEALVDRVEVLGFEAHSELIAQGDADNDVYFLFAGEVEVLIDNRAVARRRHGQHVGEMTLIDPSTTRSATVRATKPTVAARATLEVFETVADAHPRVWRQLAIELGERLRQRSLQVRKRRTTPVVFVGSAVEGLKIAKAIQLGLRHANVIVSPWTAPKVFTPSSTTINALERQLDECDFAVLVVTPDDVTTSRGDETASPRDNVVFELGMCIGALGLERTYMVVPRDKKLKLPSDLFGVTPVKYSAAKAEINIHAELGSVCTELEEMFDTLGAR